MWDNKNALVNGWNVESISDEQVFTRWNKEKRVTETMWGSGDKQMEIGLNLLKTLEKTNWKSVEDPKIQCQA